YLCLHGERQGQYSASCRGLSFGWNLPDRVQRRFRESTHLYFGHSHHQVGQDLRLLAALRRAFLKISEPPDGPAEDAKATSEAIFAAWIPKPAGQAVAAD